MNSYTSLKVDSTPWENLEPEQYQRAKKQEKR